MTPIHPQVVVYQLDKCAVIHHQMAVKFRNVLRCLGAEYHGFLQEHFVAQATMQHNTSTM